MAWTEIAKMRSDEKVEDAESGHLGFGPGIAGSTRLWPGKRSRKCHRKSDRRPQRNKRNLEEQRSRSRRHSSNRRKFPQPLPLREAKAFRIMRSC